MALTGALVGAGTLAFVGPTTGASVPYSSVPSPTSVGPSAGLETPGIPFSQYGFSIVYARNITANEKNTNEATSIFLYGITLPTQPWVQRFRVAEENQGESHPQDECCEPYFRATARRHPRASSLHIVPVLA